MIALILVILVILLLCGGGYGWHSGAAYGYPLGGIVLIVLLLRGGL